MRGSWLAVLALGCGRPATSEPPVDGGSDADADADSDGDADADTDSDTGPVVDPICPVPWTAPVADLADCQVRWDDDDYDDGVVEIAYRHKYDGSGREWWYSEDYDGDGSIETTMEWTYDPVTGAVMEMRNDFPTTDGLDYLETWTYGANGELLVWVQEFVYGTPPGQDIAWRQTYTYDANVALVDWFFERADDFGGFVVSRTTLTPGPCGDAWSWSGATAWEMDNDDDGTIDARGTYTFAPTRVITETDLTADGTIDYSIATDYDPVLGRETHAEQESDPTHPGPEGTSDILYDADGRVTDRISLDPDGSPSSTTHYTYDPDGRDVEWYFTEGDLTSRWTATWDCP